MEAMKMRAERMRMKRRREAIARNATGTETVIKRRTPLQPILNINLARDTEKDNKSDDSTPSRNGRASGKGKSAIFCAATFCSPRIFKNFSTTQERCLIDNHEHAPTIENCADFMLGRFSRLLDYIRTKYSRLIGSLIILSSPGYHPS